VSSAADRTEKATPKRRQEAQKKGQIARSIEVNTAVVLLATVAALAVFGPRMLTNLENVVRDGLLTAGDPDNASRGSIGEILRHNLSELVRAVAPIALIAMAAGLLASMLQVRPRITTAAIKPSFKKLNPLTGFKRVFGVNALVECGKAIAKTIVVGAVTFFAVWPELQSLGALVGLSPEALPAFTGGMVMHIATRAVAALLVLAALDFVYQRYRHEKSLRMSKQEVKQEGRQSDIAPEVRGQIRRRQLEAARSRMMADVPTADVVVTNPTHFAVALRYDGTKPAPEVVARGADLVAAAIREIARDHGVPVLSNPPLARALYHDVEVGHMIPDRFFAAVAEVLAFVYRTSGRRVRRRETG
jgi:flagellar biosynthetic protein FlhB